MGNWRKGLLQNSILKFFSFSLSFCLVVCIVCSFRWNFYLFVYWYTFIWNLYLQHKYKYVLKKIKNKKRERVKLQRRFPAFPFLSSMMTVLPVAFFFFFASTSSPTFLWKRLNFVTIWHHFLTTLFILTSLLYFLSNFPLSFSLYICILYIHMNIC